MMPEEDTTFRPPDRSDALEKAAASLEAEIQRIRADRQFERFFWALTVIGLVDTLLFASLPIVPAVTCLSFSLLMLIFLSKWLEVPFITPHLERWHERLAGRLPKPGETE